jgi:6-phosphofructokinase 1
LAQFGDAERDPHNNLRIAEVNLGEMLKAKVQERLAEFGIRSTIVAKNVGYELRCTDPIPFDMEYTRDLGYCAAKYLLEGGSGALITIQRGVFKPIALTDMLDPRTGRTRIRMVDVETEHYKIARRYMLRLRSDDFEDPHELAKLAAITNRSLDEFRHEFEYLTNDEPSPIQFIVGGSETET